MVIEMENAEFRTKILQRKTAKVKRRDEVGKNEDLENQIWNVKFGNRVFAEGSNAPNNCIKAR